MTRLARSLIWIPVAIGLAHAAHGGEMRVDTSEELVAALRTAEAGTTLRIAPGTYRGGLSQVGLRGTKERPIVIAAADPSDPPVIEGGGSGLHLRSPQFVELCDLVIRAASGNGLNIDDSGSTDTPAHDLVLRNIVIQDIGPKGNCDGIKLSGVNKFRIEGCRVQRWGSSGSAIDMVGCHDGVVTGCTFIEASGDMANGVQTKGGSSEIVIRRCRFKDSGGRAANIGGSTGLPYFRPADAQYEAKDITVEDCEFSGGMSAIAFVGVDGAIVRHNTIYRPTRWPLRILQENTEARFVACRHGKFLNNVVVFHSDELRQAVNVGGNTSPETFEFSGNAWCCLDRPEATRRMVQLPVKETSAVYGETPRFKDAENGDLQILDRRPQDAGARTDEESK